MTRAFQRIADLHGEVASLGLAHIGEDAFLLALLLVFRNVLVEQLHCYIEQLCFGNLLGGLNRIQTRQWPRLVRDTAAERDRREQHQEGRG